MAKSRKKRPGKALEVDEVTIDGRRFILRNVALNLDDVKLDPANPRIANTVGMATHNGDETELQRTLADLLWQDDDVRALYHQVLMNRGLVERIIVRDNRVVAEGNCRVVVYRKLHEKFGHHSHWGTIPARILPPDISPREVAVLLGEMHVAGKNTWSAFEKAGHVYRLHRDFALTQEEVAKQLRMSKSKVNQLIRAFELMRNKYLIKYPGPGSIRKFSYFEELYKKPALREWLSTHPDAEDTFVDWIGKGKISRGVQVRALPTIVADDSAVEALTDRDFAAAQSVVGADNPAATSKLFRKIAEMTEVLKKAQLGDIQLVRSAKNKRARKMVLDLNEALSNFMDLSGLDEIGG